MSYSSCRVRPGNSPCSAQSRKKLWFIIWQTAHGSAQYPSPSAIKAMPSHIYKGKRSLSALVEPPRIALWFFVLSRSGLTVLGSLRKSSKKRQQTSFSPCRWVLFACCCANNIGVSVSAAKAVVLPLSFADARQREETLMKWASCQFTQRIRSTSLANWSCKMHLTGEKTIFCCCFQLF